MNWDTLKTLKKRLDAKRPLAPELVQNLDEWLRIELTYTSNALEGNTLTRQETALVVEKGITVGGKTMREHLEAANHAEALDWIKAVAGGREALGEDEILHLHGMILNGINNEHAGRYRSVPVRIAGTAVILPNPRKVPDLMAEFGRWLKKGSEGHPAAWASEAHYRLVTIHPFVDGNGRTARLLMNLILLRHGYTPSLIRTRDRLAYIRALESAQTGGSKEPYERLMAASIKRTLEIYAKAAEGKKAMKAKELPRGSGPIKIGKLASLSGESVATIRYWLAAGLLESIAITDSGYALFSAESLERVKKIRAFQAKRLTIREILEKFS